MNSNYEAEIATLKREISNLEAKLMSSEVKLDLWMEFARDKDRTINSLQQRNRQLENPKGSHYHSLSWQGKVVFCIRKLKRPLRLQEIMQELEIMEAKTEGLKYQGDNFISVVLAKAVKVGRLHIEKVQGTRGAYYALPEWLEETGKLPEKLLRGMM